MLNSGVYLMVMQISTVVAPPFMSPRLVSSSCSFLHLPSLSWSPLPEEVPKGNSSPFLFSSLLMGWLASQSSLLQLSSASFSTDAVD